MKIITIEKFIDSLNEDLAWRKREIEYFKTRANGCKPIAQESLIRSGIALSYAHWEGYIKNSSNKYLAHVFSQRKKYNELTDNFFGIKLCKELLPNAKSEKQYLYTSFSETYLQEYSQTPDFSPDNFIDTHSNLTPELFKEILQIIGIKEPLFSMKYSFINEKILKRRNEIAHGERPMDITYDDFSDISLTVIEMLDDFKETLIDYALNKKYLKPAQVTE